MRELERLLSSDATAFERQLLRAARSDGPGPELQLRMQQAIGLQGSPGAAGVAGKLLGSAAAKVVAGALALGAVTAVLVFQTGTPTVPTPVAQEATGVLQARSTEGPAALSQVSQPTTTVPVPTTAVPTGSAMAADEADGADKSQNTVRSAADAHRSGAPPTNRAAARSTLSEEIHLLDGARAATRGGQLDVALKLLKQYDSRFPRGTMRQEATVLRVEATKKVGDSGQAQRLGKKFLKQHPESPHTERVEQITQSPQ